MTTPPRTIRAIDENGTNYSDLFADIDTDNIEDFPALQTPEDVVDVLAQLGLDADCGASPSGSSYLEWFFFSHFNFNKSSFLSCINLIVS